MNLEEGMYVRINKNFRTICLGIGKVDKLFDNTVYVYMNNDLPISFTIKDISKASHNIIDLVEVGDYVNGHKVTKINIKAPITNNKAVECKIDSYGSSVTYVYDNKDIKSIVTKEQFEAMEYRVGE